MTIGGSLVLAGCGQNSSTAPTGSQQGQSAVSGHTFRAPIGLDPAKTSFYVPSSLEHLLLRTFATIVKDNAGGGFIRENGVWTDGFWLGANVYYNWLEEPITVSPNEVTLTIRDDARWSDGEKVTGKDIAIHPLQQHIRRSFTPAYARDDQETPENIWAAFDDFEITEQSVTYRSSAGHFGEFWEWMSRMFLSPWNANFLPTHLEPYGEYADAVIETARRAHQGEIEPWRYDSNDPHKVSLARDILGKRKYVEKFSKPENVVGTGAWDLVELRGSQEFVFEKNQHHRNAEQINFDTVIFEYTKSAERTRAALKADRLDYGSAVTPQPIVESFPEHLKHLRIPGGIGSGNELALNFNHPALGTRAVRAAIMYALNTSAIAKNIHPSTAKSITTPGGDCWNATDYVSQQWIDENLTTYAQNRQKATSLMQEAGYTKDGGQWVSSDGTPISLTLATASDTPKWEPTVASQLSQFGIETSVKTLNDKTFENRTSSGSFPLWSSGVKNACNDASSTLFVWFEAATNPEKYGIFPEQQFASGQFADDGAPIPRTNDRWHVFTVQAPPVGQPNGTLEAYHPAALSLMYIRNPPKQEYRRRVKTGMWLANWFLPTIPINKTMTQHFVDEAHWRWPRDTHSWNAFTSGGPRSVKGILASGAIEANPDNPEQG